MASEDMRNENRLKVQTYMDCKGKDRLTRPNLFTSDGVGGLWTTESGEPIAIKGRDALERHAVWSLQCFPDWEWYNVKIYDTQSPDIFWVECDGRGEIKFPNYNDGFYENHFLHYFEFRDGFIALQREFMNPCLQFKALGIEVPHIIREGIPT